MLLGQTQRPRFFEGQYLGAADLNAAVDHARVQRARHWLGAHTWGIAAGLNLVEKPAAASGQVDVFIQPGFAWDGLGRPIVVLSPFRLPAERFAFIKYDATIDKDGKGRLLEVWLYYDEESAQRVRPGFEVCGDEGQFGRIDETFLLEIGPQGPADQRDPISVGGSVVDAAQGLRTFSPSAPLLYDASIPFQEFPAADERVNWLIPIGYVRWLPVQNGPGHFAPRDDTDALNRDSDKIRRFRHYIGVVAEAIQAADGALRIRDRGKDPSTSAFQAPTGDLVWVEGNLRTEGDVRVAGGSVDWRDGAGNDFGTPLSIRRSGDAGKLPTQHGDRALQAVIGPDSQNDNRFAVGPIDAAGVMAERLVVMSNGNVGIGLHTPTQALHIAGDDPDLALDIKSTSPNNLAELRFKLDNVEKSKIYWSKLDNKTYLENMGTTAITLEGGNVGIGINSPQAPLHVNQYMAVGPFAATTGQGGIDVSGPVAEFGFVRRNLNSWPQVAAAGDRFVWYNPDGTARLWTHVRGDLLTVTADGRVGIGTTTPVGALHIFSDDPDLSLDLRSSSPNNLAELRFKMDDALKSNIFWSKLDNRLHFDNMSVRTMTMDRGDVGIGTVAPVSRLHVVDDLNGSATDLNAHVAVIENISAGIDADVLALKVGNVNPGGSNNFITFFAGNAAIGRVEINALGDLALLTGGADFAESLPRLHENEEMAAGDVVGVFGGRISKVTSGAQQVMVITDSAAVVANMPSPEESDNYRSVAFIGQVMVKVRGPVCAGDYIVPSGHADGVGIAVAPDQLTAANSGQVVGQAWQSSAAAGVKRTGIVTGLPIARPLQALGEEVQRLAAEVELLRTQLLYSQSAGEFVAQETL